MNLPTFQRLRQEGQTILAPGRALHQTIRELHIGVLNMMPDAALAATERQFFRLVGESNPIAQFYMHPFTLQELPRGEQARAHIERYYDSFAADTRRGAGCADYYRGQCHPSRPVAGTLLGAAARGVRLGAGERDLGAVFLPRHPCGDAVSSWPEASRAACQALGRVPAPRDPGKPSAGERCQHTV